MASIPNSASRPGLRDLTRRLGLLYGGDYNPEQWTPDVWAEDARLMRQAGVNLASVGIFAWSALEPEPGTYTLDWLAEVIDLLHDHGVGVDLATPTASPPPWMGHRWPETLPVTADGVRLGWGSRNHYCASSPVYRERCRVIVDRLLDRFADHPAVVMWHVGNEYGTDCHCDLCADRFRSWLRDRYGDLDGLNAAWGTAFWSQRYSAWEEVIPPRTAPYLINPSQQLDYRRFTSDQLLDLYRDQRSMIIDRTAGVPVTTNLMRFYVNGDYRSWAPHLDVIADDAYPDPNDPESPVEAGLTSDLMRSLGRSGGTDRGWMLMEQAAGAVNWRGHNVAKTPQRQRLESLRAIGRGASGSCYFQWRASVYGTERFHAALVPHAGEDSDRWQMVVDHGQELKRLGPLLAGQEHDRVDAEVAIIFDWPSWWASSEAALPSNRLKALDQVQAWYRPLWRSGVTTDIVASVDDLSGYRAVLAPSAYLLTDEATANLRDYVAGGGTLLLGPFSGVVDERGHVRRGRFPVGLTDVFGLSGEQWLPIADGDPVMITSAGVGDGPVRIWSEQLRAEGAEVVARFSGGPADGSPALLRHRHRQGEAWYLAGVPDHDQLARIVAAVLADAGARPTLPDLPVLPEGVEVVRRGELLFVLNHGRRPVALPLAGRWTDVLTEQPYRDRVELTAEGAVVLRQVG